MGVDGSAILFNGLRPENPVLRKNKDSVNREKRKGREREGPGNMVHTAAFY